MKHATDTTRAVLKRHACAEILRATLAARPHVCAPIDANGNLTSDGTKTYYWNALNQLVEVKEGTTTIATFEYDGQRRRTKKTAAGVTRTYIYDAEDIVEERITGSSSDTIRYYHGIGIDQPLARKNSSDVVTYYLADHLGSIVQESSAAGAITFEREYDPWGVPSQGASTSGHAFTGREWDAETGLLYSRARYYHPDSGRFISQDPLGFGGGRNFYDYVGSGPTTRIDPTGLSWSSNFSFLFNWLVGSAPTGESLGPSYPQTKEMSNSPGAQRLREAFEANDCKDVQDVEYSTPRAAWDTLLNPSTADPSSTSAQVGGFMGKARNNGNGTVTYVIENTAGTKSFFYHGVPDRQGNGPMRSVKQTFFWTEPTGCPK